MIDKDTAARVMVTMRKVFPASGITLEQEKRFLPLIRRAQTEDAAFEAVDIMFNEGVRYPTGKDYRYALERIHERLGLQEHLSQPRPGTPKCCRFGFSEEGFVHQWLAHFDEATKASALHLAEDGADPWRRWVEAALRTEAAA